MLRRFALMSGSLALAAAFAAAPA
ncbi:MAG: hypothetical protein FD126_3769, partial [Elusimicrobia bacterium]